MSSLSYDEYFPEPLKEIFKDIRRGFFGDPNEFNELLNSLCGGSDFYLIGTDFMDYVKCQERVDRDFKDEKKWNAMSIHAATNMAKFSTDRTINDYATKIW